MQNLNRVLLYHYFESLMSLTNLCFTYVGMCMENQQILNRDVLEDYISQIDKLYKDIEREICRESDSVEVSTVQGEVSHA